MSAFTCRRDRMHAEMDFLLGPRPLSDLSEARVLALVINLRRAARPTTIPCVYCAIRQQKDVAIEPPIKDRQS